MTKQVREFAAFQRISATVVLNKRGEHVATIQSVSLPYPGSTYVDVWSRRPGEKFVSLTHQGSAGGAGYDRYTKALDGAVIEGIRIYDHCSTHNLSQKDQRAKARLIKMREKGAPIEELRTAAAKAGFRFANRFESIYPESGLRRLEDLGFKLISAA